MRVLHRSLKPKIVSDERAYSDMTPEVTTVPATADHVAKLKSNLRPEDENEILHFGITVQRGLWLSFRRSLMRNTVLIDGVPVAMYGVHGDMLGCIGTPYLLTTPDVKKVSPLKFVRIYQAAVYEMLKIFPVLENIVDAEYAAAIRLLEIIGFSVGESEPMGYNNAMFRRFRIERK